MAFKFTITDDADRQFRSLPARDRRILEAAILSRLEQQPTTPTKLIVESEEFHGHQDHPVEPPGDGSGKDAQ